MMTHYPRACLLVLLALYLQGCSPDHVDAPDVTDIDASFTTYRFDKDLAAIDTSDVGAGAAALRATYGAFFDRYFSQIVPLQNATDIQFEESLRGFLTAPSIRYLLDTTAIIYNAQAWASVEQDFAKAFAYYKYYFPSAQIPDVYTIISEYSLQRFVDQVDGRDIIGVGLDMYLGATFPYQRFNPRNPAFSSYLTRRFNADHIVKRSMEMLVDEHLGDPPGERLIDLMVHNGKRLYLIDHILPYTHDTIVMEYTAEQLDWAMSNELEMWAFFFKQDLFYKTNRMEINKYISASPSSPGMPMEAPGRTANYLGWKIVEAYMKRYPDTTIEELIALRDAQVLLDKSRYKPRK